MKMKEYKEKCPRCGSSKIKELDCSENAMQEVIAELKCQKCNNKFKVKMIWIVV